MSSLTLDQRQKITNWAQLYKHHKPFQSSDINIVLQQLNPRENPKNKFYLMNMKHVANLKIPPLHSKLSLDMSPHSNDIRDIVKDKML